MSFKLLIMNRKGKCSGIMVISVVLKLIYEYSMYRVSFVVVKTRQARRNQIMFIKLILQKIMITLVMHIEILYLSPHFSYKTIKNIYKFYVTFVFTIRVFLIPKR